MRQNVSQAIVCFLCCCCNCSQCNVSCSFLLMFTMVHVVSTNKFAYFSEMYLGTGLRFAELLMMSVEHRNASKDVFLKAESCVNSYLYSFTEIRNLQFCNYFLLVII